MKSDLGSEIDYSGQNMGAEMQSDINHLNRPELIGIDKCYVPRVRSSEVNGFAVYTRSKRSKNESDGQIRIGFLNEFLGNSGSLAGAVEEVSLDSKIVDCRGDAGNLRVSGISGGEGEMTDIEVEEQVAAAARSGRPRRFTRSAFKLKEEEVKRGNSSYLKDTLVLEVNGVESENVKALGTRNTGVKISKKVLVKGRPTTVRELFETGLLEGYPVVYNGGKRGFPLRGTIKDDGILCSCSVCKGVRVVPPCKFEIHASKSYRRASQYICLENGKSLLDVVKECRKSSPKTIEETIRNFIGPLPVKESVFCRNCEGLFLATPATKLELLCDSCISVNSEADAECLKSSPLEPLVGLTMSESGEVHTALNKKGGRGRKKRKHSELTSITKSSGRSSLRLSIRKSSESIATEMPSPPSTKVKSRGSLLLRYTKPPSDLTPRGSTSSHGSLKNKATRKNLKKLSDATTSSKSLKSGSPYVSEQSKSSWKITKKDQRMHKLVFENGGLPDGTEVAYYSNGKKLRDGYKMGPGIICRCCSTLVSPSQFEAHAGWASRRKPYMHIYTSNGVSLHEFSISLSKGRKYSLRDNDDLCIICADGGKLVCCDGCPRSFHKECASLTNIPPGKWFCTYCQNMFQRESIVKWNSNAVAAGRVSGIDPIEEIKNRCIRIVRNPEEAEVIACVICRGYDFSKTGFGPRTVILCDQCEREYHVGCLKKSRMADLKELPKGKWFCSENCQQVYSVLQNLLNSGEEKIPDSSLDAMRKKFMEKNLVKDGDLDVKWRLLNGKISSRETRMLLSQAVAIFHDSFAPIVDSETGRDFIPSLVYGRNIRGQDYSGMHCAILTVNSTVVSAGILRIFGEEMAELPLAATRTGNQGKGYFQALYSCIEKLLAFLNVKNLVLPATSEATSIWTQKFGFENIPQEQLLDYRKQCWQMMTFKGTSMLQKAVPKCRTINQNKADSGVVLQ